MRNYRDLNFLTVGVLPFDKLAVAGVFLYCSGK